MIGKQTLTPVNHGNLIDTIDYEKLFEQQSNEIVYEAESGVGINQTSLENITKQSTGLIKKLNYPRKMLNGRR